MAHVKNPLTIMFRNIAQSKNIPFNIIRWTQISDWYFQREWTKIWKLHPGPRLNSFEPFFCHILYREIYIYLYWIKKEWKKSPKQFWIENTMNNFLLWRKANTQCLKLIYYVLPVILTCYVEHTRQSPSVRNYFLTFLIFLHGTYISGRVVSTVAEY